MFLIIIYYSDWLNILYVKSEMRNTNLKICTPIQARTQKEALKKLKELKGKVDLAEIWLDQIKDLDVKELLSNTPIPVICVCKKPDEKGRFKGSYSEIADLLGDAARFGAEYVDISLKGLRIRDYGLSRIRKQRSKIIISFHDFKKTPPLDTMLKKAQEMRKKGADIVKIAVMAKSLDDAFTVILLAQHLQAKKIPHILIAMDKKGILSRVLTPFLGGTIMFAPLTAKGSTASGQLTVKELKEAWALIV